MDKNCERCAAPGAIMNGELQEELCLKCDREAFEAYDAMGAAQSSALELLS